MSEKPFHILRSSYDTLELAYAAVLPWQFLELLREAKSQAAKQHASEPVNVNGKSFLVGQSGGQGGYAYLLDTGKFGALWKARDSNRDKWTVHVKIRAYALATKGLEACKAECDDFLRAIGARFDPADARVSRIDYAVDAYAPHFSIDRSNFVTHARRGQCEHIETIGYAEKITGIRIGKMPNIQVAIYDKSRKIIADNDRIWMALFKEPLESIGVSSLGDIWRIEFRAGRRGISRTIDPRRWDLYLSHRHAILQSIATRISHRSPQLDPNRSRWPASAMWTEIITHLEEAPIERLPMVLPPEVIDQLRRDKLEVLVNQIRGLFISYAALEGLEAAMVRDFISRRASLIAEEIDARDDLDTELLRRSKRARVT